MIVADYVSPEITVKLAELKEYLGEDFSSHKYDSEGKKQLVLHYVRVLDGSHFRLEDIEKFYGWKGGNAQRFMLALKKEGRVTTTNLPGIAKGVKLVYHYHAEPVPVEQRSNKSYKRKGVTTRIDPEIAAAAAEKRLQAVADLEATNRQLQDEGHIEWFNKKILEFIRMADKLTYGNRIEGLQDLMRFIHGE